MTSWDLLNLEWNCGSKSTILKTNYAKWPKNLYVLHPDKHETVWRQRWNKSIGGTAEIERFLSNIQIDLRHWMIHFHCRVSGGWLHRPLHRPGGGGQVQEWGEHGAAHPNCQWGWGEVGCMGTIMIGDSQVTIFRRHRRHSKRSRRINSYWET